MIPFLKQCSTWLTDRLPGLPSRQGHMPLDTLPDHIFTNSLMPYLGARDHKNVALTCPAFAQHCRRFQQARANALCRMNAATSLLSHFGMPVPARVDTPQEASELLMAVYRRVTEVNVVLPKSLQSVHAIRDLVLNKRLLQKFLQGLYDHSLVQTFRESAHVPPDASREDSLRLVQEYLKSPDVTTIERLKLHSKTIVCLPAQLGQCTRLRNLNVKNNLVTALPDWLKNTGISTLNIKWNPIPFERAFGKEPRSCLVKMMGLSERRMWRR